VEKHTPGPWFPIKNHHYWEIRTGGEQYVGQQIGDACSSQFLDGGDNGKANATLMAAAPDLLAACQGAMRIVSLWNGREVPEDHEHAEEMKALSMMQEAFIEAIAKAEAEARIKKPEVKPEMSSRELEFLEIVAKQRDTIDKLAKRLEKVEQSNFMHQVIGGAFR